MKKDKIFIAAEVGSVHDGSFGNAKKLIELVAECGADAVKFQVHISEAETLKDAPMPPWFKGEPRFEYFRRTGYTLEKWKELKKHADHCQIEFMASPFSIEAAKLLEKVGVKRYKVPSGEVTNLPYLEFLAKTKKQVLLSSGMSSWKELDLAVKTIKAHKGKLVVLQCTTEYPTQYKNMGLNVMVEMKKRYGVPVGLSDHSLTNYSAFAAVVLGASVIEKHITFSKKMYGSDAANALEPDEFKDLVEGVRAIETMLVHPVNKHKVSQFKVMKDTFEKSVASLINIPKGARITKKMIGMKKPGTGIPAKDLDKVIGKKAKRDIKKDTLLKPSDLS